jgi:hypothetical protein
LSARQGKITTLRFMWTRRWTGALSKKYRKRSVDCRLHPNAIFSPSHLLPFKTHPLAHCAKAASSRCWPLLPASWADRHAGDAAAQAPTCRHRPTRAGHRAGFTQSIDSRLPLKHRRTVFRPNRRVQVRRRSLAVWHVLPGFRLDRCVRRICPA